jgi:hypothetical protein
MRVIFIASLLLLILYPLAGTSLADENSGCLNGCANDKRSSDMYCPPAGGYSNEDHNQCANKNAATYSDCIKACSPAPPVPETPPAATPEPPPAATPEPPPAATPEPPPAAPSE